MDAPALFDRTREILLREVPKQIQRYLNGPVRDIVRRSKDLPSEIRRYAAVIVESEEDSEIETALNSLAEGVALSAFRPGGVEVLGLRFEAHHPDTTK